MPLPVALGLYSVRDLYREDLDACLQKTAAIGYTGVECFGAPAHPADKVHAMLDKYHLELVGWHTPIELLEGDELMRTVDYFHTVRCTRAIVPSMPQETFESRASVLAFATRMNAIRARLLQHGIELGFHNHGVEFVAMEGGELPWAVLMDNTGIIPQLDTGNALSSGTPGLDVAALVSRWPGRAATVHVKPYSFTKRFETMIGEDDIDWSAFLYSAEHTGGTKWIIVEYEEDHVYGQFEAAAMCIHALEAFN